MNELTFSRVVRADFAMRLSNRRNQKAFAIFFVISLVLAIGLHLLFSKLGDVEVTNSFGESLTTGGIFFVFLLSFFAISSIAREIADGTLSLSLRLVPNRKRLFVARLIFWPVLTGVLYILFSLIGTPFRDKTLSVPLYIADTVLYGAVTWVCIVLMIVFVAGIFRTGALSVLTSIGLFVFLPSLFVLASFLLFDHAQFIHEISLFTPMGAMGYVGTLANIGTKVSIGMFLREWAVVLAWLGILGWFAWKRFERESTVSA